MEDLSLKDKLAQQQRALAALLTQHAPATATATAGKPGSKGQKKTHEDSRPSGSSNSTRTPPHHAGAGKSPQQQAALHHSSDKFAKTTMSSFSASATTATAMGQTFYQDRLSERIDYEEMLRQANLDHEVALRKQENEVIRLKNRLIEQREIIEMAVLREKSVKYYGGLLTSSVDAALLGSTSELSEETKRFLSKVTSTLNYLLNDGDITHSIEKEVLEADKDKDNAAKTVVNDDKKMEAIKASIKNRRGSINAVPFESALLYDQPSENIDNNANQDAHVKRAVSKSRRGTLNAVPLNVTPQPTSSLTRLQSIDDICEEGEEDYLKEEENKDNKIDHGENSIIATTQSSSMAAVICQCRQLIPFLHLTNSLEDKCSELFRTVYKRSCMGFNEKTKAIEEQSPIEMNPLNQWIGKSSFLSFLFCTGNIDVNLSLQACIYCFDKAANENATRSQYKLNMRIYYEDFLSALTSAAMFKYSGGGKQGSSSLLSDQRRKNFEKIINSSSNSFAMKDEMVYYELSNIFKYLKSPDFFTTMSNAQIVLLKAYKRCVNYACTHTGFQGQIKRQWPSNTAANGGKLATSQKTIESSGQGFYYFCKSYNIFPTLTQENSCRRVAQHVRKICDDSTTSFFACLIYLALSLASNTQSATTILDTSTDDPSTQSKSVHIDPHLSARMTSIIERIVVQIESENLKLDRS